MFDFTSFYFDNTTHNLYILLLVVSVVLSSIGRLKKIKTGLFLSFFILWFFAVTRDGVGTDYWNYYKIFNTARIGGLAYEGLTVEPGFYYLCVLLKKVCSFEYVGFIFWHFVILFFTYKALTYFRNNISYAYAMLAYVTMWYFLSFSLLRICVAASIVGFAIRFLLEKRYNLYFLIILLASCIHMSSILMIIPAIMYIVYLKRPKLAIFGLVACIVLIDSLVSFLIPFVKVERYVDYLSVGQGTGIGFNIIFTYTLVFYALWLGRKNVDRNLWHLCLVFSMFAFIVDFSGYRIEMLGRLRYYAIVPFVIYIPSLIAALRNESKLLYYTNSIIFLTYFIVKYFLFLPQLYWADRIMPYKSLLF